MSPAIVVPPSPSLIYPQDAELEVPYGKNNTASVYIGNGFGNEKDFTTYIFDWDMVKTLNEMPTLTIRLLGVEQSDLNNYIMKNYRLKLFAEQTLIFCGRVKSVDTDDEFFTKIDCDGWDTTLENSVTDQSTYVYWDGTDSNTIITSLITEMTIGENENLGKVTGNWSWENKLSTGRTIADYFQSDWWVSQSHPYDTDVFNIKKRRGRIPIVKNFYDDGTGNDNVLSISKQVDVENHLNDIVLLGDRDYSVRLMEKYVNAAFAPSGGVAVAELIKESSKVAIYVSADQTPDSCYLSACDSDFNYYVIEEFNITGGKTLNKIIDLSSVKIGDTYKRPYGIQVTLYSHLTNTTNLEIRLGRLIQLQTQFSAVDTYYTKLEAGTPEPEEGVTFDMSCQDSVWFPEKGIVKAGKDAIGYQNNSGNVLWGCIYDTSTGFSNRHRSGILLFPSFDATGKADTFLTDTVQTEQDTTITVQDTSSFPSTGSIIISDEVITYTGKTPVTFTGCSRGQTGSSGGASPHSTYTRVFEYDSTKRYYPDSAKSGSLVSDEGKKTKKYLDSNMNDIVTAEILASSVMELNMDSNVVNEGGLVTVTVTSADVLGDLQEVGLGDSVYIKSTTVDVDGIFEIISIRWFFDEKYGMQGIFTCGNRRYGFVQELESRWRVLYG